MEHRDELGRGLPRLRYVRPPSARSASSRGSAQEARRAPTRISTASASALAAVAWPSPCSRARVFRRRPGSLGSSCSSSRRWTRRGEPGATGAHLLHWLVVVGILSSVAGVYYYCASSCLWHEGAGARRGGAAERCHRHSRVASSRRGSSSRPCSCRTRTTRRLSLDRADDGYVVPPTRGSRACAARQRGVWAGDSDALGSETSSRASTVADRSDRGSGRRRRALAVGPSSALWQGMMKLGCKSAQARCCAEREAAVGTIGASMGRWRSDARSVPHGRSPRSPRWTMSCPSTEMVRRRVRPRAGARRVRRVRDGVVDGEGAGL